MLMYSINYQALYLNTNNFYFEDIQNIKNSYDQCLKCSLITHKNKSQSIQSTIQLNKTCIIYLHGSGSSRFQALSIIQHLPLQYCLCIFDFSGSGKSQGKYTTYGVKQQYDIQPILKNINQQKGVKQFIIWGRSMGAVAALLYSIKQLSINKPNGIRRSSLQKKKQNNNLIKKQYQIKFIILDAPFYNFSEIAKIQAKKQSYIPNFLMDFALNYIEQSFSRVLSAQQLYNCNPFSIKLPKKITLSAPVLFLLSNNDEIVPNCQTQKIINSMKSQSYKIYFNTVSHNSPRPPQLFQQVLKKIKKYNQNNENRKSSCERSISSLSRNKGLKVFTPSKEKKRLISSNNQLNRQIFTIDTNCTQQSIKIKNKKINSVKQKFNIISKDKQQIIQTIVFSQFSTQISDSRPYEYDKDTKDWLNNKIKNSQKCTSKIGKGKAHGLQKKGYSRFINQIKL